MEKRIKQKVNNYFKNYNNDLITWCNINNNNNSISYESIIEFINSKDSFCLEDIDFNKRKRSKNIIAQYLRCCAKRANGEQCTRKKKDGLCYCGTHEKNRPHGVVDINIDTTDKLTKTEVWLQEINGIMYYIDTFNNVYKTQDIISNKINPDIIAKYNCVNGVYSIPEYLHLNN